MRHSSLLNYTIYQIGWFSCILGAAWHQPVAGLGIALALTLVHLWLSADRGVELQLVGLALTCGVVVECYQVWAGTYEFHSGQVIRWISPPWLLMLWAQFATTFRMSMRSIMAHPWRAALFGAAGGPIAFVAGQGLGAVELLSPITHGLVRLGVTWGIALFLLAHQTRRLTPTTAILYRAPYAS